MFSVLTGPVKERPSCARPRAWLNDPYHTVVFAVRNSLWWIAGSNGNLAGIPQLAVLFTFAIPFFLAAIRGEICCETRLAAEPRDPK